MLFAILLTPREADAQAIKVNAPFLLAGCPNIGAEATVSKNISISGDIMWLPYLFKENEEVFRSLQVSAEVRYYTNPKYYYNNDMYDGFYLGPYLMWGDFNVGLMTDSQKEEKNFRREGWGVSSGLSVGYKFYLTNRIKLDLNLGLGYAFMQYEKYQLGGQWVDYPMRKDTSHWIGPTRFGISVVYALIK